MTVPVRSGPARFGTGLASLVAAAWLTVTVTGLVAAAQSLPTLSAPVNDFAKVIDPASAAELDRRIRSLQTATGDVVVVATVQTFAPYGSIDEYAARLFEQAKIGQREKDNGVLIVVSVAEHRVRIEVGYGLEEFITDGFSGDTIRQDMLPAFRGGQYGPGLVTGTTAVIQRIAQARQVTLTDVPAPASDQTDNGPSGLGVVIAIFVLFAIVNAFTRRRRGILGPGLWWGGPWSGWGGGFGGGGFGGGFGGGGGGGGGFGGFGGGMSGGGGASGGW